VPKLDNFSLGFFLHQVNLSGYWVGGLGTGKINQFFFQYTPHFDGFWFLPHTEWAANKKKFAVRPKLKVGGGGFLAHMYAYNVLWKSFTVLVLL
jgi:hypothetical protein